MGLPRTAQLRLELVDGLLGADAGGDTCEVQVGAGAAMTGIVRLMRATGFDSVPTAWFDDVAVIGSNVTI